VNNYNKLRFIYLMADYKLNRNINRQTSEFVAGMKEILDMSWLRMFTADELRQLIGGIPNINIDDLRRHATYSNGYTENHEAIQWLWEIVKSFTSQEQASFLRFATSCSRAPLLGFQSLNPKFCIQRVEAGTDENTLPTASTCMNLLRLPRYFTKQRMREKLLFAIEHASTGFGLT
jgi:ubiquitin-protein ligase E3 C